MGLGTAIIGLFMVLFAIVTEAVIASLEVIWATTIGLLIGANFSYLRWLTGAVWIPETSETLKYHHLFLKHIRTIVLMLLGSFVISVPWDYFAIKEKIWFFPGSLVEVWFLGIPLEEYFFIIFVALLVVTVTIILQKREENKYARKI